MIELDWTLFVQIFNFLLLVFLLNMVLFRPLRQGLKTRQGQIAAFEGEIAQLSQGERELLNQVQENLNEARRQGLNQREALRQEGVQAEASLLEKVKQEVDAEWAKVEKKIKEDMAKAREVLQAQVQDFAQALAAKIMGRELS
jgi:F-type H+-transporting ATPase subunit b|uniref:ATP synthase subunit b n=1 Tax=Desulfobacca acetoxidans TaxID=60893 RepID=A0A7C3SHX4_9BACT